MEPDKPEPKQALPPNPNYQWEWLCSLSQGRVAVSITAPGNSITPTDAEEAIDCLELIIRRLRRYAERPPTSASETT